MARLHVSNLVKIYHKRKVVDRVSLEVKQGEIVGLLGPNGAGKTTTFYMIVGMIRPNEGRVLIDDQEITGLPMYQRARRGIGYLSQEPSVFRKLSVRDNIMAILQTLELSSQQREERLKVLLDELDLTPLAGNKAYTLSGGERRRVELITDHNVRETLQITDHAYVMAEGKILKAGTAEVLANDPEARKIYLGERFRLD